jgi:hypothetical protein
LAQYTIEDIEIIRQKSGISYEEAVNLLEYHNGSLARALVDLEKNGRLRDGKGMRNGSRKGGEGLFTHLYRWRIKVTKGQVVIVNLSALFMIFALLTAFWLPAVGLIVALVLGYRISFERNSRDFAGESFDSIVKKASSNVRNTVDSFTRDMNRAVGGDKAGQSAPQRAEEPRTESAASGTTPVNVQFPDGGSFEVKDDADGFHEADIQ